MTLRMIFILLIMTDIRTELCVCRLS
jgi:hypothetical protein